MTTIKKTLFFLFGLFVYFIALITLAYMAGFLGNFLVPNSIDGLPRTDTWSAILTNILLILVFTCQHSIMARQGFKKWWIRIIPKPIERSTFVLFSSLALLFIFHYWQPIRGIVWDFQSAPLAVIFYAIYFLGWTIVVVATFLINHWDLFGLRQVYLYLVDRPYTALDLSKPFFYGRIRHPLYLGFLITFWATPTMTVTHLLFSVLVSTYIFLAVKLEEKDLISDFKDQYLEYKKKVPMLLPINKKAKN